MKILNRKAYYEYHIIEEFIAGIKLTGSEVKSLRKNSASITDAYGYVSNGEIFLKNSFISKYEQSSYLNHEEKADRKLLLTKKEIRVISKEVQNTGITIIPLEIFTLKGNFKVKIALVKGKKLWDKRLSIKEKDLKRYEEL